LNQINVRENRRGNQRNWKHWVHKTQDEDKHNTGATRETGNIGYTRHRTKTNTTQGQPEKLETFGYTRHRTKTNTTQKTKKMSNTDPTNIQVP
jgi:hypothetical protein